ncbi:accessory gland protein Acp29AB [Drosophila ficusphila]|uniref:accessory gland protein Acp29AB n=1 Tax=Drosophila ficusphila TaxID=30025 RepID=UPI0007E881C1|nr:accessory gland protein Acp29AB [Drosophila ficusphila]
MLKFATYFLCAFMTLHLYGSLAGAQDGRRYVCLLTDPENQCGPYCLSELQTVIDHITNEQQDSNTCTAKLNETQAKLDQIEDQLTATQIQLDNQYKSLDENLKNSVPQDLNEKLDRISGNQTELNNQLRVLQKNLDSRHDAVEGSLSNIGRKIELLNFPVRIGTRLFYIEHSLSVDWRTAESICVEMGGHLAAIKNEQEYKAITGKLSKANYWLGINDLAQQGTFISLASGKRAPYLKWRSNEPKYDNDTQHCVFIYNGVMIVRSCVNDDMHFICQSDSEI